MRASPPGTDELGQAVKRAFEIDMEHCPNCGGELTIIAVILE
jgi:hypothetical protein